jgi:sugar-specific transcriptional regulator TrmB
MDVRLLEDIGLTTAQALAYQALIKSGSASAPIIAEHINESRSNTYKLLDKLCDLGLATKDTSSSKVRYFPSSPAALEQFIQRQSAEIQLRERKLKAQMPNLLDFFFAHSEQPSIRYFQGKEGIQQIFGDMLKTGQDIYLMRSPADVSFYDEEFFSMFRKKRAKLGIKTYALTPDVPSAVHSPETDAQNLFIRSWISPDAYTANVEWDIYGDKVALISYGEEAMGMIIESAQIAESFRQIFQLVRKASSAAARTAGFAP